MASIFKIIKVTFTLSLIGESKTLINENPIQGKKIAIF